MARLLISDHHHVARRGLREILQTQKTWQIVAEAADGEEAIAKAMETKPDVTVIDHSMPWMNGLQVTREIRARVPSTEILVFATHHSEAFAHELLSAGARGYLLKSDANSSVIVAVQSLLARKPFCTPQCCTEHWLSSQVRADRATASLTRRERTVVQLIADGHSNKSAAITLNISAKTVETHRSSLMRKLNLTSSAALVRYAIRNHCGSVK
jgi:DNA-binding NarL/FixJ family response regulator